MGIFGRDRDAAAAVMIKNQDHCICCGDFCQQIISTLEIRFLFFKNEFCEGTYTPLLSSAAAAARTAAGAIGTGVFTTP